MNPEKYNPTEIPEIIEGISEVDKKKLLETGTILAEKIIQQGLPDVILLPETSARPLYYLFNQVFKKFAEANDLPRPNFVFINVHCRSGEESSEQREGDGQFLASETTYGTDQDGYSILTPVELEQIYDDLYRGELKEKSNTDLYKEHFKKALNSAKIFEEKRKIEKIRGDEILNKSKKILGEILNLY